VSQLLAHTSGLSEVIEAHRDRPIAPADLRAAQISAPGQFRYSSSGYVVLKLVAERASGLDFAAALDELVFRPAGMTQSGLLRDATPPPELALAYRNVQDNAPILRSAPLEILDGAGSFYSTGADLARLDHALAQGKLLSPATQKLMISDQSGNDWGYGWALGEQGGTYFPFHRGDFDGYHALLVRLPESRELIVILSNLDATDISSLQRRLMRILKDTRPQA
jgi:CubicO group peptidase (beta-lactamase class C family)